MKIKFVLAVLFVGILPAISMANLLKNGDFETDSSWEINGGGMGYEDWAVRSGTKGMAMYGWTTGGSVLQDIQLSGSAYYTFSAYGYRDPDFEMGVIWVSMKMAFYSDEAGTTLINATTNKITSSPSEWTQYSVSASAPSATRCVRVQLLFGGYRITQDAFKWDDASLTTLTPSTTRYVSPSGTALPPYTSWATAANSIDVALALSASRDTVMVADGHYAVSSQLTLGSAVSLQSVNGPESTVIDAGLSGRCATLAAGSLLEGFTLLNGSLSANNPVYGGGVYCNDATIRNCHIVSNSCNAAQSNSFGGGIFACNDSIIEDCTIAHNQVSAGHIYGAGIYCEGDSTISNCQIYDNQALATAIGSYDCGDCAGGGIYFNSGGLLEDSWICNNQLVGTYSYYGDAIDAGAGIYARSNVTIRGCIVSSNLITGGDSYRTGGHPKGCGIYAGPETLVSRCVVKNNSGTGGNADFAGGRGAGGGLYCSNADVYNTLVSGNSVRGGTAASSSDAKGGGIYATDGAQLRNVTVVNNLAIPGTNHSLPFPAYGGGVYLEETSSMQNCILFYNDATYGQNISVGAEYFYTYCCIENATGGDGNITNNPGFKGNDSYSLIYGSPCIDSGLDLSGLYAEDILEESRPIDGNMSGVAAFDMGAYEYNPAAADSDGDSLTDANEINVYGSNPLSIDSDGDGSSDGSESVAGTSLTNAASVLAMQPADSEDANPTGNRIRWNSVSGKTYEIMRSIDLASGFSTLASGVAATSPLNTYVDSTADYESTYYYKVRVEQ